MKKRLYSVILIAALLVYVQMPVCVSADEAAEEILNFDFNTKENQELFVNGLVRDKVTKFDSSDEAFGIDDGYAQIGKSHILYPLPEALVRSENEGVYLEVEYDIKPISATGANESLGAVTVVEGSGNTGDAYKHGGGINFYQKAGNANSGLWTSFWKYNIHVGETPYEFGKWYRCKTVIALNKDGNSTNKNCVDLYINGEKLATTNIYSDAFSKAEYIRLYASNTTFGIDNLSVRTYTDNNRPVEKGVLVKKLRDFEEKYSNYKSLDVVKEHFDNAAAVYRDSAATEADIENAYKELELAAESVFPGTVYAEADFEDGNNTFFELGNTMTAVNESCDVYGTGKVLSINGNGLAVKSFTAVPLGSISEEACLIAELDYLTDKQSKLFIGGTEIELLPNTEWERVRIVINRETKEFDLYKNGVLVKSGTIAEKSVDKIELSGTLKIDNVSVFTANNAETVADKGALVMNMRRAEKAVLGSDETAIMDKAFASADNVYNNSGATTEEVGKSAKKISFLIQNLSAEAPQGYKAIILPEQQSDADNMIMQFNLHSGAQEGDKLYNELFFDGTAENDFSDVAFYDSDGNELQSQVINSGNYDFIPDSRIPKNVLTFTLSDGTLVSQQSGMVISRDNAKTWTRVGPHKTGRLTYVDAEDNIYYTLKGNLINNTAYNTTDATKIGLYQIRKDEDYAVSHLVIDLSDMLGQTDPAGKTVTNETDIIFHAMDEDDDGYIYAGRYCEPWTGSALYVSSPGGQNFRVVDYRPDKQHTHFISINHNVYPNEVYITYDDSTNSPLCQVTTDKGGYDEILERENSEGVTAFKVPLATNSWKIADGTDGKYGKMVPNGEAAEEITKHAKKHFKQVGAPYRNIDYFGHFGVIDKSKVNKDGYTDNSNIYAIGMGEANILGGPSIYKTTDPMDADKYKPVLQTTQGARRAIEPVEGVIIAGGLAGRAAQSPQLWISYDQGDTWSTAYTPGFSLSTGAGNGVGRTYSSQTAILPYGSTDENERQVILCGFGNYTPVRAKFGGDNYYGYSFVKIPYIPAEGMKLFVTANEDAPVVTYRYEERSGNMAIKAVKNKAEKGDALRFPTTVSSNGEIGVYAINIETQDDTIIWADVIATDNKNDNRALSIGLDTKNGKIYKDSESTVISNNADAVKDNSFTLGITADYKNRTASISVNNVNVAENIALSGDMPLPKELVLSIDDLKTGTIYYSLAKFGYGNLQAWTIKDVEMKKDGLPVSELTDGTVIEAVTVESGLNSVKSPVLVTALYTNDGILSQVKSGTLTDDGRFEIGITANDNETILKFYLFKDMVSLTPVYLERLF